MNALFSPSHTIRVSACLVLMAFSHFAVANEIKIVGTPAMSYVLTQLKSSPLNPVLVQLQISSPTELKGRVLSGETIDLVTVNGNVIDELNEKGKIAPGGKVIFALLGTGVIVKAGAVKPDLSTAQAMKLALLNAKSIVYTAPTAGGAGGLLFERVIEKLGIAAEVRAKSILNEKPSAKPNAEYVANGEAELGIVMLSEMPVAQGVELAGPFPQGLQSMTPMAAGIVAPAANLKAVQQFMEFVASPTGTEILRNAGMEPAKR